MRKRFVIVAALLALSLAGCGNNLTSSSPANEEGSRVLVVPDDPLGNASLDEVSKNSDVVAVGRIVGQTDGIEYGSGPGKTEYTLFTIRVREYIKGNAGDELKVLMMTGLPDGRSIQVEGRPDVTSEDSVWLLKELDPMFEQPGQYVLTSVGGVIPGLNGAVAIDSAEVPAIVEAKNLHTIAEVVRALRDSD